MRETEADLQRLQAPLSAGELVTRLEGPLTVALGTVTAKGEPRVAPIPAFFLHGRFHVPTVAESARARHVAQRPGVSLTYYEGTDLAVTAHGSARIVGEDDPAFAVFDAVQVELGNESPRGWSGTAVYLQIEAARLFTYASA